MHLKKAFWSELAGNNREEETSSSSSENNNNNNNNKSSETSPVSDLVHSLEDQRLYREVTLALRTGLRDARSDFSFLRLHGLRNILKFLRSIASSHSTINLFRHTQSIRSLQVVPVLFQHSLQDFEDQIVSNLDHIFSVEPLKIKSPSTDAEVSLALRVLEGCCLLHKESMVLAHQFKAVQVVPYYKHEMVLD